MGARAEGFRSASPSGRLRLLAGDGTYVDIDPELVTAAERLTDESGLERWAVEHDDTGAEAGSIDVADLDRLFDTTAEETVASVAGREATKFIHCPYTQPIRMCEASDFGPCF